jgi:hypothetical protein
MWRMCLCLMLIALWGGSAFGQGGAAGGSPGPIAAKGLDWSNVADVVRIAAEVRQTAEAVERAGGVVERIVSVIARGMTEVSRNHAEMSASFDPLGYKAAFDLIREQNQTIQDLHKAEIRRLRRELRTASRNEQKPAKDKGRRTASKRAASPIVN